MRRPTIPQDVQRGAVGPVHVLDHEHRRAARIGQLLVQRAEHGFRIGRAVQRLGKPRPAPRRPRPAAVRAPAGVSRSSHAPSRTLARPSSEARNARIRLVLPMPASPETTTVDPCPSAAPSTADRSTRSSVCRSSSGVTAGHRGTRAREPARPSGVSADPTSVGRSSSAPTRPRSSRQGQRHRHGPRQRARHPTTRRARSRRETRRRTSGRRAAAKTEASTAIPTTTASSRTAVATPEACPCSVGATAPSTVAATGAKNNAEPAPIAAIPGTRAT